MTSLDMVELTGKQHKNILADIRNEIIQLEEKGRLIFEPTSYVDQWNRTQECYTFGKRGAMQLALKYDSKTRYRVIEYIEKLEEEFQNSDILPAKDILIAGTKIKQLTEDVSIMKPKADYFDALVDGNLLTSIRETAKEFNVKEKVFVRFLMDSKYIYRSKRGTLMPYANKNNGLFEVKEFYDKRTRHKGLQTKITPKGRETFRLLLGK